MKIFNSEQLHQIDRDTIEEQGITSLELMERASRALTAAICEEWGTGVPVVVFAGPGNNGGDALAVARRLAEKGYQVNAYLFNISNKISPDCLAQKERLLKVPKVKSFTEVTVEFDPPRLEQGMLVVDGLFGSGLNKPLAGGFASLVKYINSCKADVVSIDLPSGLMTEDNTFNVRANIIKADLTLTIQLPKLVFFFPEYQMFIGRLKTLDIGLSENSMKLQTVAYETLEADLVRSMLKPRDPFAHKGSMGNALIIAGSYGMAGAAILATKACLRSGVGKVTVHTPKFNLPILQAAVPEAVTHYDLNDLMFTEAVDAIDYDAVAIGPGLGQHENTAIAFISQLRRSQCPVVVDADALNILASHRTWLQQLPKGIIMTPHPKEFDRLDSNNSESFERLQKAQQLARKINGYIILKGHHSALCTPEGHVYINTTGNAGMATAGSGDVLTGIITGLLARGCSRLEACLLGMYLHGLAGDIAAESIGMESLIAGDIIESLPKAFLKLRK